MVLRDVTERKQSERALTESNSRLAETLARLREAQDQAIRQERLGVLGTMASGIAHNLNNAVAPIVGYSDLLLTHPDIWTDQEKPRRYIQAINTAATRRYCRGQSSA